MRNKLPAFIALFCILVYAGSLLYGAYHVYSSIVNQKGLAVRELDGIQNQITRNSSGFFTEAFRDEIRKKLTDCNALQGIIITGSQGSLFFEKEAGAVINKTPPGFIPRFGYYQLQSGEIDIPGIRNVRIHSAYNAINYESLVLVLRQMLIGILGALVISFLTMMVSMLRSRSAGNDASSFAQDNYAEDNYLDDINEDVNPDFSGSDFGQDDSTDIDDDYSNDFSVPEPEQAPASDTIDDVFDIPDFDDFSTPDASDSGDDFHLDDFLDESDLSLPEPSAAPEAEPPPRVPNGLYSPRSNIGWEAYTHDRLASELHRSASSEQDLVVLLMECADGVNCDARLYKKIADEAVEVFNLHDLTCEYGNSGITVIIPNANLEEGITKAESFHARLFNSCFDSFHSKRDFLTGISSRSGRLIEADRILLEAEKALERAKVDAGSPIVAFKSDPEKYREYVKKNTTQG